MPGRHRDSAARRAYLAAGLLAAALLVAGAGATLAPRAASLGPAAGDETAGVATVPPAVLAPSPSVTTPSAPASVAPSSAVPVPPKSPPRPTPSLTRVERYENEVLALVNVERSRVDGCGPVHVDERLRTAARAHSADMATNNYFSHTGQDGSSPWDRARRAGYQRAIGENIAYGYGTPAEVMRGWMNSPGHKANILNCAAKALGVGLAYSRGGTPYWTQLFGSV